MSADLRWLLLVGAALITACGSSSDRPVSPVPPPAPAVTLTLDRAVAYVGIDSAVLSWQATNATRCLASGSWAGDRPLTGTFIIRPDTNFVNTYGLQCSGAGGSSALQSVALTAQFPAYSTCGWSFVGGFWNGTGGLLTRLGEYLPQNNAFWQWDAVGRYMTSCMALELHHGFVQGRWNWLVPVDTLATVFYGYPSIGTGGDIRWKRGQTTSSFLPMTLASITDSLIVSFDFTVSATGHANNLIDININLTAEPDECHNVELMIMTYAHGPNAGIIGDNKRWPIAFEAGGYSFTVPPYGKLRNTYGVCAADSTAFLLPVQAHATHTILKGDIPLKPYIDYLVGKGTLDRSWTLQAIFFGTEIGGGSGALVLNRYRVRGP